MKLAVILSAGALAVAAVAIAAMPLQDAKAKSKPDDKAMGGMDSAAMHAKMMEINKPGAEHAELRKMVGTWQVKGKNYDNPAQPTDFTGTSTIELVNDRFIIEKFSAEMPGMGHYEGTGTMGFNNNTKQYEHVWRDAMNTGMMWSSGTKAADGTTTLTGRSTCFMGEMACRTVTKMTGDNAFHFDMYCTIGSAPEMKMMEMDYTKK